MFKKFDDEKDTLELLGNYTKRNEPLILTPIKEKRREETKQENRINGSFRTKKKIQIENTTNDTLKKFITIVSILAIMYMIQKIYLLNQVMNLEKDIKKTTEKMINQTHSMFSPDWKEYMVTLTSPKSKETETVNVFALNEGHAGSMAFRQTKLSSAIVEKCSEVNRHVS